MDVEAGHAIIRLDHLFEGFVGDGEQRVPAEHGPDHVVVFIPRPAGEFGVFADALLALFCPVPLGDLVAQTGPQAQLPGHVPYGEQAAGNFAERGVVVEDRGDAVPDALQYRGIGAGPGHVQGQVAVDVPPCALQYLQEICGVVARDREPPGQPRIDVGVGVNQPGHDDAAVGVDAFGIRIARRQRFAFTHFEDGIALDDHRPVGEVGFARVAGQHPPVCD